MPGNEKITTFVSELSQTLLEIVNPKMEILKEIGQAPFVRDKDDLFVLLRRYYNGEKPFISESEIKLLCWNFGSLPADLQDYFLNDFLKKKWNPQYIEPLMLVMFNHWPTYNIILVVLSKHRKSLSNQQLNTLCYILNEESQVSFTNKIINEKISLEQSSKLLFPTNQVGLTSLYYSNVIIAYVKRKGISVDLIKEYSNILQLHNKLITSKQVIAYLVIEVRADRNSIRNYNLLKDELIKLATERIGDIEDDSRWIALSDGDEIRTKLKKCREILRSWINGQNIRIGIISAGRQYKDRAEFWSQYEEDVVFDEKTGYVNSFRIMDPNIFNVSGKETTLEEKIIKKYGQALLKHVHPLIGNNGVIVLLKFKKYTILEQLDGGVVYMYKNGFVSADRINYFDYVWKSDYDIEKEEGEKLNYADLIDSNTVRLLRDDPLTLNYNNVSIKHQGCWQMHMIRVINKFCSVNVKIRIICNHCIRKYDCHIKEANSDIVVCDH